MKPSNPIQASEALWHLASARHLLTVAQGLARHYGMSQADVDRADEALARMAQEGGWTVAQVRDIAIGALLALVDAHLGWVEGRRVEP